MIIRDKEIKYASIKNKEIFNDAMEPLDKRWEQIQYINFLSTMWLFVQEQAQLLGPRISLCSYSILVYKCSTNLVQLS